MRVRWWLLVVAVGVMVVLAPGSPLQAGEATKAAEPGKAEKKAEAPAAKKEPAQAEKPAGMVGSVVAAVPQAGTLVVDVPLGNQMLRVGGWVTPQTRIVRDGKAVKLDSLKAGERVRISWQRIPTGTNLTSVEVLK